MIAWTLFELSIPQLYEDNKKILQTGKQRTKYKNNEKGSNIKRKLNYDIIA